MTTDETPGAGEAPKKKEEDFLYLKLVKDIKNGILTGVHLPGSQLPSYNELAKSYGIHRLTVRRALRELKQQGLVYTIPAKGVYVAGPGAGPPVDSRDRDVERARWSIGIVNDIVEPALFGYFHFEIIEQIRNLLQRDLHSLQILPSRSQNRLDQWIAAIRNFELSGLILLGPLQDYIADQLAMFKPVVHLDPQCRRSAITTINIDNEYGGYLAGKHLLGLGHTHIALVTAVEQECSEQRLLGFRRAMLEAKNPEIRLRIHPGNFSSVSGSKAAQEILNEPARPTAVFCFNDEMAVGALQTFTAAGISVPRDMSLMGFDDVAVSNVVAPPLTTVNVSTSDLAAITVQSMASKLSGMQVNEASHTITPRLIVRASTAPPPGA
ncbi:MAG: GntR family transcriptional regulator [Chthoniobacterales bacterium]